MTKQKWRRRITRLTVLLLTVMFILPVTVFADEFDDFYYGDHKLTGSIFDADRDAPITVRIGKKTFNGKLNDWSYSFNIPEYYKIGTPISISYKDEFGRAEQVTSKVEKDTDYDVWIYYVYPKHKKIRGYIVNAHKGDILSIKVGKKTYKMKVKRDAKKYKFKLKIKKAKAGTKITLTLKNKFKQKLTSWKWKVFTSDVVKIGMTKKQVKLLAYWSEPTKKNIHSNTEQWCYDDNDDGWTDTYLYFRNGRVSDWQYSE